MDETKISKIHTFLLGLFALSVVYSVSAVEAAMLAMFGLALYRGYLAAGARGAAGVLKSGQLFAPWMVYLGVSLVAAVFAVHPKTAIGYFPSDLIKYICLTTLFIACGEGRAERVIKYYVFGAMLIAVIGIVQSVSAALCGMDIRANAFMNAVRYGEIMAIALIFIVSRLLITPKKADGKLDLFSIFAAVLVFVALLLSQTRGAYLGFAVALLAMFILAGTLRKKLLKLGAALCLLAIATAFAKPEFGRRLVTIADGAIHAFSSTAKPVTGSQSDQFSAIAINTRLELWKTGVKMIKDHPVLGIGPANVKKLFPVYYKEPFPEGKLWGSLHSIYIQHTAERGFIGLAALLFLFGAMFALAVRNLRRELDPFTLWAAAVLPAYFVMNLTEVTFQHIHTSFAVFLAIAASQATANKKGG